MRWGDAAVDGESGSDASGNAICGPHALLSGRKGLISVFQEFFVSINKAFILTGGLGTKLLFYGVLRLS